jgi:uncharacterized phage protein gp47/JayE
LAARARTPQEVVDSLFAHAVNEKLLTSTTFRRGRFGIIFSILASEISIWEQYLLYIIKECFLQSATEEQNIERLAAPLRYRFPAKPSRVKLTFYWTVPFDDRPSSITIPYLHIAETEGRDPIQYLTTEERVLYSEQDYVTVSAKSRITGMETKVNAGDLVVCEPRLLNVGVINEEESWGGADQESIEELKENALIARYALEKGTLGALISLLYSEGLTPNNYNLVENNNGFGNFSIYIDTTVDDQVEYIKQQLKNEKAAGIYVVCQKAEPVYVDFDFDVNVANPADLLPNERKMLKQDLTKAFSDFIDNNGVGKKIMLSQATHYLYEELLYKYEIYDIEITPQNLISQQDSRGNILVEEYEVVKPNEINIEIITDLE